MWTIDGLIVCLILYVPAKPARLYYKQLTLKKWLECVTDLPAVWQQHVLFWIPDDFAGCQISGWSAAAGVWGVCSVLLVFLPVELLLSFGKNFEKLLQCREASKCSEH